MLSAVLARTRLVIFHRNKLFFPIYVFIFESFYIFRCKANRGREYFAVSCADDRGRFPKYEKRFLLLFPTFFGKGKPASYSGYTKLSLLAWEGGAAGGTNGEDEAKLFLPPSPPPPLLCIKPTKLALKKGPVDVVKRAGMVTWTTAKESNFVSLLGLHRNPPSP